MVSGRNRRLTFIECPANDMRAMIDLAKVADLVDRPAPSLPIGTLSSQVLLMVDAVRGFEMETFEFINIMQVRRTPHPLFLAFSRRSMAFHVYSASLLTWMGSKNPRVHFSLSIVACSTFGIRYSQDEETVQG